MKFILSFIIIVFINLNVNAQRTEKKAIELADSIYQALNENPDIFCDLIKQYSGDLSTVGNCGFYDFTNGDAFLTSITELVQKRSKKVCPSKRTKIMPPLKSIYGYHIIKPLGISGKEIKFKHLLITYNKNQ